MNIDDLTLGQIKEIQRHGSGEGLWRVGKKYLIRTVTMALVGELSAVTEKELGLKSASWVADTGRFHDALRDGTLNEIEPFPADEEVIVGRGAVVDACPWGHALPTEQK